jgi:hypothetical protein
MISSYEELQRRLDVVLDGRFDKDTRRSAEISLGICDLIRLEFDSAQLAAVRAARDYWNATLSEDERTAFLKEAWRRIGDPTRAPARADRQYVLNRLVLCPLVTNEGLTITSAEFLLELAEALGLPASVVAEVFIRHIPDLDG